MSSGVLIALRQLGPPLNLGNTEPGTPSITIQQGTVVSIPVGSTRQLTVVAENIASPNYSWSSDDELVATVDANGLVTAIGEGTCIITVSESTESVSDAITVNVRTVSGRTIVTTTIIHTVTSIT